jgi:hypothetical protein
MAGSDTFRGCSFQAAYCVVLALDVLEGAGTALILEGDADVVDAAIETAGGLSRITQAKTKREPSAWRPQQIAGVIRAWLETSAATAERFEFVTDGSLGSGVTGMLAPALQRVAAGVVTPEDREQLEALGLDPDAPALGRVKLHSRLPDGRTLLERETLRVLELRERVDGVTADQARDLVARLFARVVFDSGEHISARRRLECATIAELIGVPLEHVIKRPLAPGTLRRLLTRADVLLLLDGAGELVPEQRSALLDDLIALRDRQVGARFVFAARDGAPFKRLALTEFALQGLDKAARRSIASRVAPAAANGSSARWSSVSGTSCATRCCSPSLSF